MMSKKQWLALLAVFVTYLLLGAAIFYHIEEPLEHDRRQEERNELWQIHNLLSHLNYSAEFIGTLEKYCHKPMVIRGEEPELEPMLWNFYNAFFFVITVVSTIGYGNLAPTCPLSRILMILYALIGIPINGILLASLGEFFSVTLLRARHRHKHESATLMIMDIMRYLVPGFIVFIFLPAAVFTYVEHEWTYDMGVYYAFVTLTTIGFGDLVAGQSSRGQGGVFVVYRIALIVWVVFGLGYLVMLLGFITRAMRSKKMARLEHKLAENLRMTQSKIWNGFTKDMAYLRRIINEMYLQKLKMVPQRSQSWDGADMGAAMLAVQTRGYLQTQETLQVSRETLFPLLKLLQEDLNLRTEDESSGSVCAVRYQQPERPASEKSTRNTPKRKRCLKRSLRERTRIQHDSSSSGDELMSQTTTIDGLGSGDDNTDSDDAEHVDRSGLWLETKIDWIQCQECSSWTHVTGDANPEKYSVCVKCSMRLETLIDFGHN